MEKKLERIGGIITLISVIAFISTGLYYSAIEYGSGINVISYLKIDDFLIFPLKVILKIFPILLPSISIMPLLYKWFLLRQRIQRIKIKYGNTKQRKSKINRRTSNIFMKFQKLFFKIILLILIFDAYLVYITYPLFGYQVYFFGNNIIQIFNLVIFPIVFSFLVLLSILIIFKPKISFSLIGQIFVFSWMIIFSLIFGLNKSANIRDGNIKSNNCMIKDNVGFYYRGYILLETESIVVVRDSLKKNTVIFKENIISINSQ